MDEGHGLIKCDCQKANHAKEPNFSMIEELVQKGFLLNLDVF